MQRSSWWRMPAFPAGAWLRNYERDRFGRDAVAGAIVTALVVPQALGYATIAGVPVPVGLYAIPVALVAYAQVVAGLLRTGWVAEFLSKPIVSGFVFGLSIVIVVGEVPGLLGLPAERGTVLVRLVALARDVVALDPLTAALGLGSLVVLFVGAQAAKQVPRGLLVVVVTLTASHLLGFADREFVATGAANLASGLFGGLGVAGSLSKTAAVVRSGATSQVASLVAAVLALGVLVLLAPSLSALPRAVLSAVVIHAVWGLMDTAALRRYARIRNNDLVAALGALLGVIILGTLAGLLVAVGMSLLGLIYRASRVEAEELGRIAGEKAAWGSIERHPERERVPGVLLLRLTAPVFWVNAAAVEEQVPAAVDGTDGVRALILDLEATDQLDTTSTDMLHHLLARLRRREVDLYLVRVMYQARVVLKRSGFRDEIGDDHLWRTISQGVERANRDLRRATDVPLPDGHRPDTDPHDTEPHGADEHEDERVVVDLDKGADANGDVDA